ncbi:hypothetical protein ACHAWF_008203 [Thalassiosira exigua]
MNGELEDLRRAIDAKLTAAVGGGAELSVLSNTDDAPDTLEVLACAFVDDPMFVWIAGLDDDDPRREEKLYNFSRTFRGWAIHRFMDGSRGVAVGARASGGSKDLLGCFTATPGSIANARVIDVLRCIYHHGLPPTHAWKTRREYGANAARRLEALVPLVKRRAGHMKDAARWLYLQTIGVHPVHQGKGHGKCMLELLNDVSTSMGAPIYLETQSKGNESMYKWFGYRTLEQVDVSVPGGSLSLRIYLMRRDP